MKRSLSLTGLSALTVLALAYPCQTMARDGTTAGGGVSASRDGASVSHGGSSVSASRDGASVSHGGSSVSASRDGASVSHGGSSVSAGRGGVAEGFDPGRNDGVHVDAAGNRHYDDFGSWIRDLQRSWSGSEPEHDVSEETVSTSSESSASSNSSSVKQVSEATVTSRDGEPAAAEAKNTKLTEQN
jgi:hypothetical protein